MANHKSNEVVNGTPTQGDVSKESGQKKGQTRKKEKIGTHTPRVLRTRSQEKPKAPESVDPSPQDQTSTEKKRKKIKKIKKDQNDEFSKIRAHLRYLLQKMSYEQLFIDAYVGEGWKGQRFYIVICSSIFKKKNKIIYICFLFCDKQFRENKTREGASTC